MESMRIHNNAEKRVVSFFIWDPELEYKIDCEVKMIDGISKLLNVATTTEQRIECHKALVLSQQRMLAFMAEIQRKQQSLLKRDDSDLERSKATVILTDIRLPLVWTSMKAKSEQKKFAVFCLARIGCEIIDTQMKFVDKKSTEILFTDKLAFDNVPHDFQLYLEVYALNRSLSLSSAAKEFANRYSLFSTNRSYRSKRKLGEKDSSTSSIQHQSKFVLIARTAYTKESAHRTAKVRYLKMEHLQENPLMQLPIHTSFISRFIIQPLCYTSLSAFSGILEYCGIYYSCTLNAGYLKGEEITRNEGLIQRRFSVPITTDTLLTSCDESLSFVIDNGDYENKEFFVQDRFTLYNWLRSLRRYILDICAWKPTLEHIPAERRYSYQHLNSFISSSTNGRNTVHETTFRTKALSLDNLYRPQNSSQSKENNPTVDKLNGHSENNQEITPFQIRI